MAQKCNYPVTQELLGLAENLGCGNISLSTENRDWQGRVGHWDLVTLIDAQNVGFSVDSGEIVIRYFSDHVHFGETDFREAGTFLTRLLACPLRRVQKFRGRGLAAEKYTLLLPDGQEICRGGWIWYRPLSRLNPFCRRRRVTETFQYDREKGLFTTTQPWQPNPAPPGRWREKRL